MYVSMDQNHDLVKLPTKEEVKQVVLGLNGDSARGLDGFTEKIIHVCWEIIGQRLNLMLC